MSQEPKAKFEEHFVKKTFIEPTELSSNFTLQEDELHLFLKFGETELKKSEKTKEEVIKDQNVRLQSGFEITDPRNLLGQSVCDHK